MSVGDFEPAVRVEDIVAAQIMDSEESVALEGLAVTVTRASDAAFGIVQTHATRDNHYLETELTSLQFREDKASGTIQALDAEHNALWLRPRRLTRAADNTGFLVVAQFAQDSGQPAYNVLVRRPGWRDRPPFNLMHFMTPTPDSKRFYNLGKVPRLTDRDWGKLNKQASR